jgi:phenylacetate-CoA ligase
MDAMTLENGTMLRQIDSLSRKELDELQLRRLKEQLMRVHASSEFYRRRFAAAAFDPSSLRSIEEFSERAPVVDKAEFLEDQQAHPPFGTRLTVAPEEIARWEVTSGTSGLGQEVYGLTSRDIETVGSHIAWGFANQGLRPGNRIAVTLPLGYLQGPWGGDFAARALGCSVIHLGLAPSSQAKLEFLVRFGINALFTPTPTYLMRLTTVASEMGLEPRRDLSSLKVALIAGEPYPTSWVTAVQEFWGINLVEGYGSTQGGFAATCQYGLLNGEDRGVLHCMDSDVLTEVVDPTTGAPVEPGDSGELIITTLRREASPTIRFRTRDLARLLPHDHCPCGRQTVAIEAGTISRLDEMIKIKGMNIWPSAVDEVMFATGDIDDYIAEVSVDERGYERVQVKVAFRPDLSSDAVPEAQERLSRQIFATTNVTMDIIQVSRESLPAAEYKSKRWFDHRDSDFQAFGKKESQP